MSVVAGELHRMRRGREKAFSQKQSTEPARRPARAAVTLALAHMIQRAIDRGEIRNQAEVARRLGVTRARVTQMLDLTLLAPRLQEVILFLETTGSDAPLSERNLRTSTRLTTRVEEHQRSYARVHPLPRDLNLVR